MNYYCYYSNFLRVVHDVGGENELTAYSNCIRDNYEQKIFCGGFRINSKVLCPDGKVSSSVIHDVSVMVYFVHIRTCTYSAKIKIGRLKFHTFLGAQFTPRYPDIFHPRNHHSLLCNSSHIYIITKPRPQREYCKNSYFGWP